jgi:hypothetical protein
VYVIAKVHNSTCRKVCKYTVRKANGNQRSERNFPFPLLANPIRGSEQTLSPSTVVFSIIGSGWTLHSNICSGFFQENVGKFHYTEWTTYTMMNKSSQSLVQLLQAQPIGSSNFCLKKKSIDGSQIKHCYIL